MKRSKWFAAVAAVLALTFVLGACSLFGGGGGQTPINYYLTYGEDADYMIGVAAIGMKSTVKIETIFSIGSNKGAAGTGVIIDVDIDNSYAYIVTNNHVVRRPREVNENIYDQDVSKINVTLHEATSTVKATLIKSTDTLTNTDLALIRVKYDTDLDKKKLAENRIIANFLADELKHGQHVMAIGNGLGYGISVCDGLVSNPSLALNTEYFKASVIQTSAPINSGNSGGGLFDMRGNLVGINTLKAVVSDNDDPVTVFADNISFSLKMSQVKAFVESCTDPNTKKKITMTEYVAEAL